jgi:uncharacterized Zn finger protein
LPIPIYRPYVFLRCKKCGRKTDHALVSMSKVRMGETEQDYECQDCGEIKKIYELINVLKPQVNLKPDVRQLVH